MISNLPIPYIYVEGDYETRGQQHGKQCKELIKRNVALSKKMCLAFRQISEEVLLKDIIRFKESLERYDKSLYDEMVGVAKGAEVALEDIILLNVRSELMHPAWNKASVSEGCTSMVVAGQKARNNVFLAQTWDWAKCARECLILLHSNDLNGMQFITATEAGIIGNMGCNNHGLGIVLNYLPIHDINTKGAPYHILLRRALESRNIDDLQRNLLRTPIAFAVNIMSADKEQHVIGYELTAGGIDFYKPKENFILHTNHIISDKLIINKGPKPNTVDSEARYNMAYTKLRETNKIGYEELKDILMTHGSDGHNICRHSVNKDNPFEGVTVYSIIMNLTEMKLYYSVDCPCENPFVEIDLKELFK